MGEEKESEWVGVVKYALTMVPLPLLAVFCGFLLFGSDEVVATLRLTALRDQHGQWAGVGFLLATGASIMLALRWAWNASAEHRKKRAAERKAADRRAALRALIASLTPGQRGVFLYVHKQHGAVSFGGWGSYSGSDMSHEFTQELPALERAGLLERYQSRSGETVRIPMEDYETLSELLEEDRIRHRESTLKDAAKARATAAPKSRKPKSRPATSGRARVAAKAETEGNALAEAEAEAEAETAAEAEASTSKK